MSDVIKPKGWPKPRGYSHGMLASTGGRVLAIAGQIGSKARGKAPEPGLVAQFAQALDNIVAVLDSAGGKTRDVIAMNIFVTDRAAYRAARRSLGSAWRKRFGKHYPAIALVEVAGLMERSARVEIQALAVVANRRRRRA